MCVNVQIFQIFIRLITCILYMFETFGSRYILLTDKNNKIQNITTLLADDVFAITKLNSLIKIVTMVFILRKTLLVFFRFIPF